MLSISPSKRYPLLWVNVRTCWLGSSPVRHQAHPKSCVCAVWNVPGGSLSNQLDSVTSSICHVIWCVEIQIAFFFTRPGHLCKLFLIIFRLLPLLRAVPWSTPDCVHDTNSVGCQGELNRHATLNFVTSQTMASKNIIILEKWATRAIIFYLRNIFNIIDFIP